MANIAATPEVGSVPLSRVAAPEPVTHDTPPPTASPADLRLVIEEGATPGSYIYKTVDRRTGEVVAQFPREEVLQMRSEEEYAAGHVIRARA